MINTHTLLITDEAMYVYDAHKHIVHGIHVLYVYVLIFKTDW